MQSIITARDPFCDPVINVRVVPRAAKHGQNKNRASLYPMAFSSGSMTNVMFPPIMFMKNSVKPIMDV